MHWFREIASNDLAVAAVTCLSAPAVWASFWFEHQQKVRVRQRRQLIRLVRLRHRLHEDVEPWANEWPEDSFNADWYLPNWHALPIRGEPNIERFNRLVMRGDFPQDLTKGLARLEEAARRFHEVLERQEQVRRNVPDVVTQHLQPVFAAARGRTAPLTDDEIARLSPGLGVDGVRWVQDYFQRNRRLHVEAIGRQGGDGLYEAWRSVMPRMDTVQAALQEGRNPWWAPLGHASAIVLAVMGALFVVNFWASYIDDRFQPSTADSTLSAADSAATGAPDTSGAHPAAVSDSRGGSR